jgi:hypothetical protein
MALARFPRHVGLHVREDGLDRAAIPASLVLDVCTGLAASPTNVVVPQVIVLFLEPHIQDGRARYATHASVVLAVARERALSLESAIATRGGLGPCAMCLSAPSGAGRARAQPPTCARVVRAGPVPLPAARATSRCGRPRA